MPAENYQVLQTPAFTYRGFDIPALDVPGELIDNLGTAEPAYKLAPKSAPLAWRVGLYMVGRDLELGEDDAETLPEPVRQAGRMAYEDCQARRGRGAWHKDGILFEPEATIRGSVRPGKDYFAARFFRDIEGFEQTDDGWKIKPSPDTRESRIWVPYGSGHFIVPTGDGAYNPITGTPFETIKDRDRAINRWLDAGLTEEQAEAELSRFYRGSNVNAVSSWSFGSNGPLCVSLGGGPWDGDSSNGSFAVSSSAERSEAPGNKGFRVLTEAEYAGFERDRKTLGHLRENLQELAKK